MVSSDFHAIILFDTHIVVIIITIKIIYWVSSYGLVYLILTIIFFKYELQVCRFYR